MIYNIFIILPSLIYPLCAILLYLHVTCTHVTIPVLMSSPANSTDRCDRVRERRATVNLPFAVGSTEVISPMMR